MSLKLTNNAVSRLAAGISAVDTSLTVLPGDGALFPALGAGDYHPLTLIRASDNAVEIVKATAKAADVFTIERAQESTAAIALLAGDRVELRLTAANALTENAIHGAASKTAPVDADEFGIVDSAASNVLKKLTWANLKAGVFSAWGALVNAGTDKAAPVDADALAIMDSAASNATKKLTFANLKAWLQLLTTATVASAATVNLTGQAGKTAHISGTTGIGAWTMTAGQVIDIIFDGILVLTHHATTNNLPGGVNITTEANSRGRLYYDGTAVYLMSYTPANGTAVVTKTVIGGANKNLVIANNTGSPNSKIDISADEIVLKDSSGRAFLASAVSVTADIAVSGANGLDTGAEANSTWYYLHVIYNPATSTIASLLSLSKTAPTLPSGYTYSSGFLGAVFNDGSGNLLSINQRGNKCRLATPILDADSTTQGATGVNYTITAPPLANAIVTVVGLEGAACFTMAVLGNGETDYAVISDVNTAGISGQVVGRGNAAAGDTVGGGANLSVVTTSSSQIRLIASQTINRAKIITHGWEL